MNKNSDMSYITLGSGKPNDKSPIVPPNGISKPGILIITVGSSIAYSNNGLLATIPMRVAISI